MRKYLDISPERDSDKFGCDPYQRSFQEHLSKAMLILDKDAGPTSHQAVDKLKKIVGIDKIGHSGTLDPQVTGVLVCGLGKATRLMEYMLLSDKEYVCHLYLHSPVSRKQLDETTKAFTGTITQLPPRISAVKRQERQRKIYSLEILETENKNQDVLFRVRCERGTYIRKLCTDMAEHMGIKGQMTQLRRTKAGPFTEEDKSISLDKLRNLYDLYKEAKSAKEKELFEHELRTYIRPQEELLKDMKTVIVQTSAIDSLCHGADLAIPGVSKAEEGITLGETVALLSPKGELVAIGKAYLTTKDLLKKKKGAFIRTEKVFMDIDVYPSKWNFEKGQKHRP